MTWTDEKTSTKNEMASKNDALSYERVEFKKNTKTDIGTDYTFKRKIVWGNAIGFLVLHLLGLYGFLLCFKCRMVTLIWAYMIAFASGEGITIGAHRFYSHKSFKATFTLRLILNICQTLAGQNCMYIWVRDHRQHHKFSDTDADPHNANRGFFFSHIGWLMSKKHPKVIEKGRTIDMSDLEADSIVMFQKKYYKSLYIIFAIVIPVAVPIYFWNETFLNSFLISYILRYTYVLNLTWLVNSAAHLYGTKPFDKYILPVQSKFVAAVSIGEGWHNYHHTFPWDYRAAELGSKYNLTATIIDAFHYLGLAYDLRTAPYEMIEKRTLRTGDGSHHIFGDERMRKENKSEETKNGELKTKEESSKYDK